MDNSETEADRISRLLFLLVEFFFFVDVATATEAGFPAKATFLGNQSERERERSQRC